MTVLEVHQHETTTQPLLLRGGGGGLGSRDPPSLVLFLDVQSPMDVFTDNSRNSLENFCSCGSVEVCDPGVKVSDKYTHSALYRPVFRVCQARTNEDRLLFSSPPVQDGTRRGHSPASRILFRLHQTILQTPVSASSKQTPLPKDMLRSRLTENSDHSPPLISLYLITELAHDKNSMGLYLCCASLSEPSRCKGGLAEPAESPLVSGVGVAGIDVIVALDIIER